MIGGEDLRTGVTAFLPHPGNLFREKVPGAVFVGNAFCKAAGSTQDVESINPLVPETSDGYLNDIRGRHITRDDVFAAVKNALGGVALGSED
jgi:D-aminopeptidase